MKKGELIEAAGFRKTGYQALETYKGKGDVFRCDIATKEQRKRIVDFAISQIGGHYDYFLLGWEFLRYEFNILLPYREPTILKICSGLWATAYREAGIDLCPGILYPSPGDLAHSNLLRKIGNY